MARNRNSLVEKVTVHFSKEDYKLLLEICHHRTEDVSGFIRRATLKEVAGLQFLPADRKKALEIHAR